jgi:hypothetical protein
MIRESLETMLPKSRKLNVYQVLNSREGMYIQISRVGRVDRHIRLPKNGSRSTSRGGRRGDRRVDVAFGHNSEIQHPVYRVILQIVLKLLACC